MEVTQFVTIHMISCPLGPHLLLIHVWNKEKRDRMAGCIPHCIWSYTLQFMWGSMNDQCYENDWMWQDSCRIIQTALFVFTQKGVRPQRKVVI